MEVLHLNVALIADKFYSNMLNSINGESHVTQSVYVPYSEKDYQIKDYKALKNIDSNINLILSPIKNTSDRVFYFKKINKYFIDLQPELIINSYDLIHAHSLFTDGGVALRIHEQYDIPYIVAVRTTDTDFFMKYFPHLKNYMRRILEKASAIVYINSTIKDELCKKMNDYAFAESMNQKSYTIPNGVDKYWLDKMRSKNSNIIDTIKLIQVSRLIKTKNVDKTIKCVKKMVENNIKVSLDVVGEGPQLKKLSKLTERLEVCDYVTFHGFIDDKKVLRDLYHKANIFILPSYSETFGISYLEALSQGIPVIGIANTGVYGFFQDKGVGEFIENASPTVIMDGITNIVNQYSEYEYRCNDVIKPFHWDLIAKQYICIYNVILKKIVRK